MWVAAILEAVALQGAQVVGVPRLSAVSLEDRPVPLLAFGPDLAREQALQIFDDAVVVEKRVVDPAGERPRGGSGGEPSRDDQRSCRRQAASAWTSHRSPPPGRATA